MVMARGHHARNDDAKLLQNLLEACGQCIEVPESYVDIHTGLSGSGVAFVSIVFPLPSKALLSRSQSQALGPQVVHEPPVSSAISDHRALLDHQGWPLYQTLGLGLRASGICDHI